MILKINKESAMNTAVKGEYEGKKTALYMYITVNESNILPSLESFASSKGVTAFNYEGGLEFLQANEGILKTYNKPITVRVNFETVGTPEAFNNLMQSVPSFIRVVVVLPSDFNNMRFVHDASQKYPNIHFEGGRLIRLAGCRIGAILEGDIPRKIAESRIDLTPDSEHSSVLRYVTLDDLDTYEFFEYREPIKKVRSTTPKAPKAAKTPKAPKAPKAKAEPKPKTVKPTLKSSVSALFGDTKADNGFNNF